MPNIIEILGRNIVCIKTEKKNMQIKYFKSESWMQIRILLAFVNKLFSEFAVEKRSSFFFCLWDILSGSKKIKLKIYLTMY